MAKRCEVCERFRPEGDLVAGRELVERSFGERSVLLCRAHAGIAQNSGVATLGALRELFAESEGKRSYVSRRGSVGGARAGTGEKMRDAGRRASDAAT